MSDELIANALAPDYWNKDSWSIKTYEAATWALMRIDLSNQRIAALDASLEAAIAKLRASVEAEKAKYQKDIDFFHASLEPWTREQLAGQKRKSMTLAGMALGFRDLPEGLDVTDEAAVIEWADQHCPDAVKRDPRIIKTPLKKYIEEHGELPPGVNLAPGGEKFFIKPRGEA